MKVNEYNKFVKTTDQTDKSSKANVAIFGILGEIGSVVSVIKKHLVHGNNEDIFKAPTQEIREELGDLIWYCFFYASLQFNSGKLNILKKCISEISKELSGKTEHASLFAKMIGEENKAEFQKNAKDFKKLKDFTFDEFQKLAFLTARTKKETLLEVCLAVLPQLGAELMREKLPNAEKKLHPSLEDREKDVVLGEIAWHIAAIASLFDVSLNQIVEENRLKVNFRRDRTNVTPLHDREREDLNKFPRNFEICFLTIGKRRSRMYYKNKPLGDDLTDNYYDDDGYRFHDVLHLANAAYLGWSPVLRSLMRLKRKSFIQGDMVDEVEDGARARIVEEAIVKAMHMEGVRTAKLRNNNVDGEIVQLFENKNDISFSFLKFLHEFTFGLESYGNKYWEWEDAIKQGFYIYHQLRKNEQGTVIVDLDNRKIEYKQDVYVDLTGDVVAIGSAAISKKEKEPKILAVKTAVLSALKLKSNKHNLDMLSVSIGDLDTVCIKALDDIRCIMWERKIISFKVAFGIFDGGINCTALAMGDPVDQ